LASLYNGNVYIWNYKTQNLVKSFEVSDLPGKAPPSIHSLDLLLPSAIERFSREKGGR
jgi:hypothetical protein